MPDTRTRRRYESTTHIVQLLTRVFQPKPGDDIRWEAIEEVLAPLTRRQARLHTIMNAWKAHLRKTQNVQMVNLRAEGFRILFEHERIGAVRESFHKNYRAVGRTKRDADDIQLPRLNAAQADEARHVQQFMGRVHRALTEEQTRLQQIPHSPAPAPEAPPQRAAVGLPTICQPSSVNFLPHWHDRLTTNPACIIADTLT
jgi:hypothetical protein